jgi:hypothetical protein
MLAMSEISAIEGADDPMPTVDLLAQCEQGALLTH